MVDPIRVKTYPMFSISIAAIKELNETTKFKKIHKKNNLNSTKSQGKMSQIT